MSGPLGWLVVGAVVVALLLAVWLLRVIERRSRHVDAVIDQGLADMEQRPEFQVPPADWPLRESPPPGPGCRW